MATGFALFAEARTGWLRVLPQADGGVRSPARAVSPAARGPEPWCPSAGREAQGTAQEEEGKCAAVRLARRVVSHDRYGANPDRRHRCHDRDDGHQRSRMGYEQMADREPFCFLVAALSR